MQHPDSPSSAREHSVAPAPRHTPSPPYHNERQRPLSRISLPLCFTSLGRFNFDTYLYVLARAATLVLGGGAACALTIANVSAAALVLLGAAAVVAAFFRRGWCGRLGGVGARRGFRAALPRVDPGGRRRVSVRVGGGRRSVRVLSCARPRVGARARRCVLAPVNQRQRVGRGARAGQRRGGRRGFFPPGWAWSARRCGGKARLPCGAATCRPWWSAPRVCSCRCRAVVGARAFVCSPARRCSCAALCACVC